MSNEAKRDVFNQVAGELNDLMGTIDSGGYYHRYETALPDDLPVIPKEVGEWLTWCKGRGHSLKDALDGETRVSEDTFARAWVLGVWRVEETGEIVKLEETEHD